MPTVHFFACKSLVRTLLAGLLVCLLSAFCPPVRCEPLPVCVVVLVPGLQAQDLAQSEFGALGHLLSEGGSAWMVSRASRVSDPRLLRPDGRETDASLLTTLGSGARAVAPLALPDSPADRLAALRTANASLDHSVPLGALGDLFHRRQLKTATLGDAISAWPDQAAWYLAMDSAGRVDLPMTHSGVVSDPLAPFGVRTDTAVLLADFDAVRKRAGLIVLACAALDRADRYAPYCRPAVAAAQRRAAFRTLNALLTGLQNRCRAQNGAPSIPILLLAPGPAASSTERLDRLAPIVWWGDGPGILATASTRRPGLVLNTDLLATLAERLQLPLPPGATGRPFHTIPSTAAPSAASLAAQYREWLRTAHLQNAPGGLPTLQLLLPLIGTLLLLLAARAASAPRSHLYRIVRAIAPLVLAVPLAMLLLPLLRPATSGVAALLLTGTLLLLGLFAVLRPNAVPTLFRLLTGLLVVTLLLDLPTGTHLLQSAWMSYSVVEGARFYGIGNEYMGVGIGAACVLFGLSRPRAETTRSETLSLLSFAVLFLALTLAMGVYGAKVGAIPSAGTAFGITLLVWKRGRLGLGEIAAILLFALAGLGLLAYVDSRHAVGDQTHFIRALTGAGGGTLPEILLRKLQLEGWLLLHSAWSATLILAAASLLWLRRIAPQAFASRRSRAALSGVALGALACLFCNDSGLTAAALLLLFAWAWAALAVTEEENGTGLNSSLNSQDAVSGPTSTDT